MTSTRTLGASALSLAALFAVALKTGPTEAQEQSAIIDDSIHRYVNLTQRVGGGPGGGSGVDGDNVDEYAASATATFSNFTLNGISLSEWQGCRDGMNTVQDCLVSIIGDRNDDGFIDADDLHHGEIGGDVFEFDLTVTNTSGAGVVLTAFGFQSKFSKSPALGSRIGDKLFKAVRVDADSEALGGVKKNGTSNGLFDGKRKFICVNSSTDYPASLNAGTENETLECAGGRIFDFLTSQPVLADSSDVPIEAADFPRLPKGLLPGQSTTIRMKLDSGTDDGALHRAHDPTAPPGGSTYVHEGPLRGDLNLGAECPTLIANGNIEAIVDFGDVKILRDSDGNCAPSFFPFEKNQFLTFPRRNWAFTDILDTRDDWPTDPMDPDRAIVDTLDNAGDGVFSFLDIGNLVDGELNFASLVKGFGEHGEDLDPACDPDGSQPGACGGVPYVPIGEFYTYDNAGKLVRQEVAGTYSGTGVGMSPLTATVNQATASSVKATDPFEETGNLTPPDPIGGKATIAFRDFEVIADDPDDPDNQGGQAGGNLFRVTMDITNTSAPGSGILLTSANFQTKQRALTDINDQLDGSSIVGRQDLRLGGADVDDCGTDPAETRCFDTDLMIGRFPNVIGNSLLSVKFVDPPAPGESLRFIKKNGPFTPVAPGFANFICIKSGSQDDDEEIDQDVIETCSGNPDVGLAPGESQTVRIELDYGDFRGLILRVETGTIPQQEPPFGLAQQGGDFDCRDQRRLPYCHPDLTGLDWFTAPLELEEVIYVTVHQEGNAATVMNYEVNFGQILAMGGFIPSAEFSNGEVVQQVAGEYCKLPGGGVSPSCEPTGENLMPVARFTSLCTNLTCTFNASGSTDDDGTIVAYDWTFGEDGSTASGVEVQRTYATAGPYEVTLTVTDDDGATGSLTETIQVPGATNDPPIAAFTFSCDTLTCTFDGTGSEDPNGSIVSYDWDFGDGDPGTGVTPSHTYDAAGTYTVTLTVTDNDGAMNSTSQSVTVEEEASGGISLSLSPSRVRGLHQVELTWSGATTSTVEIRRGTQVIATVDNDTVGDNTYLDRINARGQGTYTYQVCELPLNDVCSEPATAVFN